MERDCKKCIHHISGVCDAWNCKMETLEDYREKVIDEFAERMKAKLVLKYGNATVTEQYVAMQATDWCNEIAEQMKGEKNG